MTREMEGIEKLFGDLESNNTTKVEEAKKKFTEYFSLTKETWLVNGLMDIFIQTQSSRIVDILVKVQAPHDKFIFDRLADWIHGPNKNDAITLFGHIVKKHPSWLHKVASHNLFKDILKLLKTDSNIVSLMSALFCIIILLPIIPTSMPHYLQELFDVFLYLASWNCNNVPRLTEDQLIHLQIGLSTFFQRLYGMYPCNFISYLKDHVIVENKAIFIHTIKPLLETVKMHPLLLTANRETEKNNSRWREMEPHDVVVECSKFSVDYLSTINSNVECPHNAFDSAGSTSLFVCDNNPLSSVGHNLLQNPLKTTPYDMGLLQPLYSLLIEPKDKQKEPPQKLDSIWSPTLAAITTPPPLTGTIPHTPTPSMSVFNMKTNLPNAQQQHQQQQQQQQQQICPSASPPEAAVEATPETTPLKDDIKTLRQFPVNSGAVRAILSSQPSSPMKYVDGTSVISNPMINSPKMQCLLNDRNLVHMEYMAAGKHEIEIQEVPESAVIKPSKTELGGTLNEAQQQITLTTTTTTITDLSSKIKMMSDLSTGSIFTKMSQQGQGQEQQEQSGLAKIEDTLSSISEGIIANEDQEVDGETIKMIKMNQSTAEIGAAASSMVAAGGRSYECGEESEGSPCSAGGLHVPSKLSMQNYAQRFQKWRIRNKSESTTSCKSGEASPTEPNLLYGDSTPSDDDAKKDMKLKSKLLRSKRKSFTKQQKFDVETQTIEQVPQAYEQIFLEIFSDEKQRKSSAHSGGGGGGGGGGGVGSAMSMAMTPLSPHSLLDQYIETSIKQRSPADSGGSSSGSGHANRMDFYKDQIQLIHLQLQYERYRREMHAERNRRLLGKSRANIALQMDNDKLKEQKEKLSREIEQLTSSLNKACIQRSSEEKKHLDDKLEMTKKYQTKCDENRTLLVTIETLQRTIAEDAQHKSSLSTDLQLAHAEIFNLQNDLQQAQYHADMGLKYKDELNRLQSEVLLMGETQIRCREKLQEIEMMKTRQLVYDEIAENYEHEAKELRSSYERKASQLESVKSRILDQESRMARRDQMFTEQKRLLKSVTDGNQEKYKQLDEKYSAQKATILRLEQEILELRKNSTAVNVGRTVSPDSEKTDMVGSLEYTSELSLSLASSESLSNSLKSVTELKNLHPLIMQQTDTGIHQQQQQQQHPQQHQPQQQQQQQQQQHGSETLGTIATNVNASRSAVNRPQPSDDIPVPVPGPSQLHHHHK